MLQKLKINTNSKFSLIEYNYGVKTCNFTRNVWAFFPQTTTSISVFILLWHILSQVFHAKR